MRDGLFTGVNLERYFNDTRTDAINARKIINGTDKADLIASYYKVIFNQII
jgi:putative chitinase